MKTSLAALGAIALSTVYGTPLQNGDSVGARASGGNSWLGTNLYYIQGLSDADQDAYLDALTSYGIKVLRVWANRQSAGSCEKGSQIVNDVPALEDEIGVYNHETLDALDKVLQKMADRNLKAIISPHDGNSLLHDDYRSDAYEAKWGSGYFYEKQEAFDAYDKRLSYILNYQGATSGKVWKDWSDVIMAFDLQNEPMTAKNSECTSGDTSNWICGRATHIRNELGSNSTSPILVASGGIGGDIYWGCNFISAATTCEALDAIAVHRYASFPGNWDSAGPDYVSQAGGKLVFIEEWGIDNQKVDISTALPQDMGDMDKGGVPSMYWQFLPQVSGGCSYDPKNDDDDPFGIFVESGTDIEGVAQGAAGSEAAQDWSAYLG